MQWRITPSANPPTRCQFIGHGDVRTKDYWQTFACRNDMSLLMRCNSASEIVGRADIDVAIAEFEEIDVPHTIPVSLRSFGASGATRSPQGEGWRAMNDDDEHYVCAIAL